MEADVKGLIGLLLAALLNAMFLVDLVKLVEKIIEALFKSFVVLFGEGFLVDSLEDFFLFGHELIEPTVASGL